MTEKRFYLMNVGDPLHEYGRWCKPVLEDGKTGKQYEGALEVMDLLNEQHETIQRLEAQLSHLEYRFFEYRNKAKGLPKDEVKETLQKRYNHLQKLQQETEKPPRYWQGAIMEIEVIADCLGVDLE